MAKMESSLSGEGLRIRLDLSDFVTDHTRYRWIFLPLDSFFTISDLMDKLRSEYLCCENDDVITLYLDEPFCLTSWENIRVLRNGDVIKVKLSKVRRERKRKQQHRSDEETLVKKRAVNDEVGKRKKAAKKKKSNNVKVRVDSENSEMNPKVVDDDDGSPVGTKTCKRQIDSIPDVPIVERKRRPAESIEKDESYSSCDDEVEPQCERKNGLPEKQSPEKTNVPESSSDSSSSTEEKSTAQNSAPKPLAAVHNPQKRRRKRKRKPRNKNAIVTKKISDSPDSKEGKRDSGSEIIEKAKASSPPPPPPPQQHVDELSTGDRIAGQKSLDGSPKVYLPSEATDLLPKRLESSSAPLSCEEVLLGEENQPTFQSNSQIPLHPTLDTTSHKKNGFDKLLGLANASPIIGGRKKGCSSPLLTSPPPIGSTILYKVLDILPDSTPGLSEERKAQVVQLLPESSVVLLTDPTEEKQEVYRWSQLVQPKLA